MISYAIIRDTESDKNVAVVVHDSTLTRLVFKTKDPNSDIARSLGLHYDRGVLVHEPKQIGGHTIMVRRRAVPKDGDYLEQLLGKAVKLPYGIRTIGSTEGPSLDAFLDNLVAEQL